MASGGMKREATEWILWGRQKLTSSQLLMCSRTTPVVQRLEAGGREVGTGRFKPLLPPPSAAAGTEDAESCSEGLPRPAWEPP